MITEVQMLLQRVEGHKLPSTGFALRMRGGDIFILQEDWDEIKKDMELYKAEIEKKGG